MLNELLLLGTLQMYLPSVARSSSGQEQIVCNNICHRHALVQLVSGTVAYRSPLSFSNHKNKIGKVNFLQGPKQPFDLSKKLFNNKAQELKFTQFCHPRPLLVIFNPFLYIFSYVSYYLLFQHTLVNAIIKIFNENPLNHFHNRKLTYSGTMLERIGTIFFVLNIIPTCKKMFKWEQVKMEHGPVFSSHN